MFLLGGAIFQPFFTGMISLEEVVQLLSSAPIPYEYLLVLASRFVVAQRAITDLSKMTHLLEALLKRHVKPLVRAFADLYEIIIASRNYKAALVVCAALVTAAEEHRRISQVHFTV